MKKELLTSGEVAKYCHVTNRAVLQWIQDGKLKSYQTPGKHNRIRLKDFMDFLIKYNMPLPKVMNGIMPRKRILIVDDNSNVVRSIKRILDIEAKYEIDVANDGFDAGRKLVEFLPDLVLLDIKMPGIDGYEVIRRMKQIPQDSHIRVIAISAYFDEEGKAKILSMGADACLDKPFETKDLLSKLNELLYER